MVYYTDWFHIRNRTAGAPAVHTCRIPPSSEATTIDAAAVHVGNTGLDLEDPALLDAAATWHITTFLLWAADRDLLAARLSPDKLRADPLAFLTTDLGGQLCAHDLTAEGAAFAAANYRDYLDEIADLCVTHEIASMYHIALQPNLDELRDWMHDYLDECFDE